MMVGIEHRLKGKQARQEWNSMQKKGHRIVAGDDMITERVMKQEDAVQEKWCHWLQSPYIANQQR